MPIIVDGYNFTFAWRDSLAGDEAAGRAAICRLLGDWSDATGEQVTVVFDGVEPDRPLATQLGDPRIRVFYSGGQMTADNRIAQLVAASTDPRRLLVVSSDHEVQRSALRREAQVADSEAFSRRMSSDIARANARPTSVEPSVKSNGVAQEHRDDWLREFGFDADQPPPFEHP